MYVWIWILLLFFRTWSEQRVSFQCQLAMNIRWFLCGVGDAFDIHLFRWSYLFHVWSIKLAEKTHLAKPRSSIGNNDNQKKLHNFIFHSEGLITIWTSATPQYGRYDECKKRRNLHHFHNSFLFIVLFTTDHISWTYEKLYEICFLSQPIVSFPNRNDKWRLMADCIWNYVNW